jgi:ABC-2 type transport system ATP-binding protein
VIIHAGRLVLQEETEALRARGAGLDLGPVALQDLFVHLTQPSGGPR